MRKFLFIFLLVSLVVFAQEMNFNLMGSGARALGMGGAFIAVSDDASAITWNPAGLTQLLKPEIGIMGGFKMESATYDGTDWYSYSHGTIDFASIVMPVPMGFSNLVMAAAYHNMIDIYAFDVYDYQDYNSTHVETLEIKGAYSAITPAIAFDLPMVSIGAGADIWFKGPTERWVYHYTDTSGTWDMTRNLNYSIMGIGFVFGGLITPPGGLIKLGATCRLPFSMKYNSTYTYNAVGTGIYADTSFTENYESRVKWPLMFGFGGSVNLSAFTLAFDYEMRKYSNMESDGVIIGYPDCNQFRVGMEYLLSLGPLAIPFRFGFMTDPRTYTDDNNNQVVGKYITFGTGLLLPNINFDISMQIGSSSYTLNSADISQSNMNLLASFVFRGM